MIKQYMGKNWSDPCQNDHGSPDYQEMSWKEADDLAEQESEKRIQKALDAIESMRDAPVMDTIPYIMDEYGLSPQEMERVIHRWVMQ